MDRLPALIAAILALAACETASDPPKPASRVDVAKTVTKKPVNTAAFCDHQDAPDKAKPFAWPALAAGSKAPAPPTGWRWVNFWATWCKPCVEEMPRLARWQAKLAAAGHPVELVFISVDESEEIISEHRKAHPDTPQSLRVADVKTFEAWYPQIDANGTLPIHVFVDSKNRVRCMRGSGVRDKDYDVVEQLLSE
jgi:thiol-disulfide isomerase/thioredoxin